MPGTGGGGMGGAMHGGYGQPLVSADLPVGTITVKVVGARLEDKRVGISVTLVADGGGAGAKIVRATGSKGRARFDGLKVGSRHVAEISASGRVVRSSVLVIPSQGGLRVL
ncbi:MAG: hypothetical protein KAI47_13185, partial [Deltaproteobacteria bacterium]|nr:hypothetical protein [Deltaproteobacteria bacterium]